MYRPCRSCSTRRANWRRPYDSANRFDWNSDPPCVCSLQRQTKSFFCFEVDGQDEQVIDGTHDQMMVKAAQRSALIVIESQIIFGTLEILFNMPTRTTQL